MAITRDKSFYLSAFYTQSNGQTPLPPVNGNTILHPRWRTGESCPNWRQKIALSQNATTPMTAENTEVRSQPGSMRTKFKWDPINGFASQTITEEYAIGDMMLRSHQSGFYPTLGVMATQADNRARANFYKQVRETQTKLQGMVTLGEFRETMRMFKKPLSGIQDLIRSYTSKLRKLKKQKPKKWRDAIAETWLEQRFGWNPLLNDVQDARDAYNSLLDDQKDQVVHVQGSGTQESLDNNHINQYNGIGVSGSRLWIVRSLFYHHQHVVRYRGAVVKRAATTATDRFARFGFDANQFIPTAWELLPWSFLIDYFANVGDVLDATFTVTSNLKWINKTDIRRVTSRMWMDVDLDFVKTKFPAGSWQSTSWSNGWSEIKRSRTQRTVGVGLYPPELYFRMPRSDFQLMNIAALLQVVSSDLQMQHPSKRNFLNEFKEVRRRG